MDNPKELTLPSGKKAIIKEINAGEFLDATDAPEGKQLSPREITSRLIAIMVVSIDGVAVTADNLRALPVRDYVFLSKETAKLINADFSEAKNQ